MLACPFHGWTWNLEGKLSELPCAWDFPHVRKDRYDLPEARVGVWGGFVFVNMDDNAIPLEQYLEPLPAHAAHAEMQDRYVSLHIQKELPCNWKVASEAFVESYHTPVTHSQLKNGTGDINTQYDTFTDHVNRLFSLAGVASPNAGDGVPQQVILDTLVLGDRTKHGGLKVPEGGSARRVMADYFKGILNSGGKNVDNRSVSEIIDTVGYQVFPNGHFFLAPSFPIVYRFRRARCSICCCCRRCRRANVRRRLRQCVSASTTATPPCRASTLRWVRSTIRTQATWAGCSRAWEHRASAPRRWPITRKVAYGIGTRRSTSTWPEPRIVSA